MATAATAKETCNDHDYYKKYNVELGQVLANGLPLRFIRCNPRFSEPESLTMLRDDLGGIDPLRVPWLEGYFALPGSVSLNKTRAFQEARVYGQDVSSGAAVAALMSMSNCEMPKISLRILELCTAPGLKLCAIADHLLDHAADPTAHVVVGVELSQTRMAACKSIVRKYQNSADGVRPIVRTRLYHNDGTKFGLEQLNLVYDSVIAREQIGRSGVKRKRMNKSAKARENKKLVDAVAYDCDTKGDRHTNEGESILKAFDLVLVDAECSNDGSLIHVQKRVAKSFVSEDTSVIPLATCTDKVEKLVRLQRNLLERGFELLRSGGTLVYSTCSLSYEQNEGVLNWFLQRHALDAEATEIRYNVDDPLICHCEASRSVRFFPNTDGDSWEKKRLFGGGFFIARIRKT